MSEIDTLVRGVLDDALTKYTEGEKEYGRLDVIRDPRNFLKEAEEELLDTMVYCAFEIVRIRRVDAELNRRIKEALSLEAR